MKVCNRCGELMEFKYRRNIDLENEKVGNVEWITNCVWIYIFKCPHCEKLKGFTDEGLTVSEYKDIIKKLEMRRLSRLR